MRRSVVVGVLGLAVLAGPMSGQAQGQERLNRMIPLLEQGLPIVGITHPAITAGRGGGAGGAGGAAATPAPAPVLADVARETVAYRLGDYEYNNYSPATAERFMGYMAAILAAGGSARTHGFVSKVPIYRTDPSGSAQRIAEQLNAGHTAIFMQEVETAEEVKGAIAAMRLRSQGGTRPDEGIGFAAAYWGMSVEEYRRKADVWPLNPEGELLVFAIVESRAGIANIREIAAVPGLSVLTVGAGTLGGVFSSTNAEGQRVRDQAAFDAGVEAILAACKEFGKVCSYPANNTAEVEALMARGFNMFTLQSRNQAAFDAVEAARRLSGRSSAP